MKIPELDQPSKNIILIGLLAGIIVSATIGTILLQKEPVSTPTITPEQGMIINRDNIGNEWSITPPEGYNRLASLNNNISTQAWSDTPPEGYNRLAPPAHIMEV